MFDKIKGAALSAFIGLSALAAIPAAAHAEGVYLNFGQSQDGRFGVYAGDRHDGYRRDRDFHRDYRRPWQRGCTPDRAMDKAERMGLHRVRVVDMGRNSIKVAGRKFGDRVVVVFGRERGCPVLWR